MPRPKRPGGTQSTEWPKRINGLFERHPLLTVTGIAQVLTDLSLSSGGKRITPNTLSVYKSTRNSRRPPDYFIRAWQELEAKIEELEANERPVIVRADTHGLTNANGQLETVWLPVKWALHRCEDCGVNFIGAWNAKRCPECR